MHTPPYKVLVAAPREAARELGRALRGTGVDGVNADADVAAAFADGFAARERRVHQRHRLHRLTSLVPPDPPPSGRARTATTGDAALLERWTVAFGAEAGDVVHDVPTLVADRLSFSGFMLWEDEGEPVSYAAANRQLANAVRIGPVYTPPEQRRRGYAAGATAAAAAAALAGGATEVLLFTDLANPTSNALYQRLGFEGLVDRVLLEFA
jgi:predicted GNAT family acetyltransferase